MKGTHRVKWDDNVLLKPGEYSYRPGSGWFACTPNGHLADLSQHDVMYHDDDRTITVVPSILVSGHQIVDGVRVSDDVVALWHGFLERGTWRADG